MEGKVLDNIGYVAYGYLMKHGKPKHLFRAMSYFHSPHIQHVTSPRWHRWQWAGSSEISLHLNSRLGKLCVFIPWSDIILTCLVKSKLYIKWKNGNIKETFCYSMMLWKTRNIAINEFFIMCSLQNSLFEIWHVFPRMKSKNSIKGQTNTTYTHFVIRKFSKFHLFWLSMYNTRILLPISIRDASNIKQYTGGSEKPIHFQNKCPLFNLFWKSNLVSFNTFSMSFHEHLQLLIFQK